MESTEPRHSAPTRVGRYAVGRRLGRGWLGTVYEAHDEQLGRPVALKVLNEGLGPRHTRRLLAEARACARIDHPHVVSIYEVGEHEGRSFIAMERVRGPTLRVWQGRRPGWRECVAMYRRVSEGMAAAHDGSLLHRDFKPDHCLVDETGSPRVLGFGDVGAGEGSPGADERTRTETQWGTPEYVPPEQILGAAADERGDQYSVCVALYEAVVGVLPFDGDSGGDRLRAKMEQRWASTPAGRRLPRALWRVLERGLRPHPQDRWPSMHALVEQLRRLESRRLGPVMAGVLAIGTVVGIGAHQGDEGAGARCDGARAQLDGVWDEARREAVQRALLETSLPHASRAWQRTGAGLDARADAWVDAVGRACEAGRAEERRSGRDLDLRLRCLERRRVELGAAVDALAVGGPEAVTRAWAVVEGLPPVSRCEGAGGSWTELGDESEAVAVRRADALVARVAAERRLGRLDRARASLDEAERSLAEVGYEAVRARAVLERGLILRDEGEAEAADRALRRALELASRQRRSALVREVATALMWVVGADLGRPREALQHHDLAWGLAQGDPLDEVPVLEALAAVQRAEGRLAEAEATQRRALRARARAQGDSHPDVARAHHELGSILHEQGRRTDAREQHRLAVEILERELGPEHPRAEAARAALARAADGGAP